MSAMRRRKSTSVYARRSAPPEAEAAVKELDSSVSAVTSTGGLSPSGHTSPQLDPVRQRPSKPPPQPRTQPAARLQIHLKLGHRVCTPSVRLHRELVDRELRMAEHQVSGPRVGVVVVLEPASARDPPIHST